MLLTSTQDGISLYPSQVKMTPSILVLNDSADMLELYRDILMFEGYRVLTCPLRDYTPGRFGAEAPDLILLDYPTGLHDNGWEILHQLKQCPQTRQIPLVLCTTTLDEAQKQVNHLSRNRIRVVRKPFEIDELVSCIEDVMP